MAKRFKHYLQYRIVTEADGDVYIESKRNSIFCINWSRHRVNSDWPRYQGYKLISIENAKEYIDYLLAREKKAWEDSRVVSIIYYP